MTTYHHIFTNTHNLPWFPVGSDLGSDHGSDRRSDRPTAQPPPPNRHHDEGRSYGRSYCMAAAHTQPPHHHHPHTPRARASAPASNSRQGTRGARRSCIHHASTPFPPGKGKKWQLTHPHPIYPVVRREICFSLVAAVANRGGWGMVGREASK